ncbi:unnamed protein product [Rotaria sp. Silwood1]|nr:unnamed protein product [Rotaria sp. Silwood1]
MLNDTDNSDSMTLTPLEERIRSIYAKAFHNERPNVNVAFGQMGGTSLDAIQALSLIRQQICKSVDATILFANPSIRELARAIQPLLALQEEVPLAIIRFPSNLLKIEYGVTAFGGIMFTSFEMTPKGLCRTNEIHLGSGTNLGNWCVVMPGARLAAKTIVGVYTLVTQETNNCDAGIVLLGIPARKMPFVMPNNIHSTSNMSSFEALSISTILFTSLSFLIGKIIFIAPYTWLPCTAALFVHTALFCTAYHCSIPHKEKRTHFTYSEVINSAQQFFSIFIVDFHYCIGPFLSGTQYLNFLYRALGTSIGYDVILHDISSLVDPHLVTIGDHVRLNIGAYVQCHTFEQRLLKLAPVTINHSSLLMSRSVVLSGSILQGQNRILPCTLVMKDDQLPYNTNWSGVPARQVS